MNGVAGGCGEEVKQHSVAPWGVEEMVSYSSVNRSVNVPPLSVSNTTGVSRYGNSTEIKRNKLTAEEQELLIYLTTE